MPWKSGAPLSEGAGDSPAYVWKEKGPGVHLGILGGGVLPGSLNPDPVADQKMLFSTPFFRPDL